MLKVRGQGKYSVVMAICMIKQSNLKFVNTLDNLTKIDFDRSYLLLKMENGCFLNVPGVIHECNSLKEVKQAMITHINSLFKNMKIAYKTQKKEFKENK
jgi:hypothetical protein